MLLRAAMVLQFAAGGAVYPFISILLRDRGIGVEQLSLILVATSGALLFFPFLWGMVADRYVPLNRLFVWLNLGAAAALGIIATQTGFWGLLIGMVLYTIFLNPCFTLANALAFHHLDDPREQFGTMRAWGSVGWIVPFLPIAIWCALESKQRFDFTLYVGMGICVAMALLGLWLPHTPPGAAESHEVSDGKAQRRMAYFPAVRQLMRDRDFLALLISMFLMAGSYNLSMYYAPPFLEDLGVPRPWIGPVQGIGVIFEIVLFQWLAGCLRRLNYAGVILLGCVVMLVRHVMFTTLSDPWSLSLSYLLAGAFIVYYFMGVSMLVNHLAGLEIRATAQTLISICSQGLGPMFANWASGRLAAVYHDSFRPVFLFATLLSVLAALLIISRWRHLNEAGARPPNGAEARE